MLWLHQAEKQCIENAGDCWHILCYCLNMVHSPFVAFCVSRAGSISVLLGAVIQSDLQNVEQIKRGGFNFSQGRFNSLPMDRRRPRRLDLRCGSLCGLCDHEATLTRSLCFHQRTCRNVTGEGEV